jgi:O-antigen/teichoic acid export membrane protein
MYALGLSLIFFLTIGVFEWLGLSLLRMAPGIKDPTVFFGTIMTCLCGLALVCTVTAGVVLVTFHLQDYVALTLASLFATFASAWFELKQRLQLAELRERSVLWTSVTRAILTTSFISYTAYAYKNAPTTLVAMGAAVLIVGLAAREPRLSFARCRFDRTVFLSLLRFGFPLAVSVGLATILMSVDKWMLQVLLGPRDVGLFTAATLIAQVPIMALASSLGPWSYSVAVQALESRPQDAASSELVQHCVLLSGIIIPAGAGIVALSGNLAHLVVGPAYWPSTLALAPWLAAAAVLSGLRAFYIDFAFQLGRHTSPLIWITLLAVLTNIALDYVLIPSMGQVGAAIGSLTAITVSFIVAAWSSRRVFPLPLPAMDMVKILLSATLMFAVLRSVSGIAGTLALLAQITGGVVVYALALLVLNVQNVRTKLRHRLAQRKVEFRAID